MSNYIKVKCDNCLYFGDYLNNVFKYADDGEVLCPKCLTGNLEQIIKHVSSDYAVGTKAMTHCGECRVVSSCYIDTGGLNFGSSECQEYMNKQFYDVDCAECNYYGWYDKLSFIVGGIECPKCKDGILEHEIHIRKKPITKPKRRARNFNFATFDIEATEWINAFALGFYDGKKYTVFDSKNCVKDFIDFLMENDYSKYKIFSHYGGIYDHNFLIDEFYNRKLLKNLNLIISSQAVIKLEYKNDKKKLTFCDSGQILPMGLAKLTKIFDVEHKKLDTIDGESIDRGNLEKYKHTDILRYLKNDTIGLHEVVTTFFDRVNSKFGIYPKLTLASTGMSLFNHMNNYSIESINSFDLDAFLRLGYRGGRVEVFMIYIASTDKEKWKYKDYNSLYPSKMKNNFMPIGKYFYIEDGWEKMYKDNYRGVGLFNIKAPILYIPFLPVKLNKKLYFPIGEFQDYYTFTEIKYALTLGYKCEFIKGYMAKGTYELFNEFVDTIYDDRLKAKRENNKIDDLIDKLFLNACSGKFGEKKIVSEICFNLTREEIIDNEVEIYNENPLIYLMKSGQHRKYHNVGIIAEVTALARIELYSSIKKVIDAGYKVAYCDTDSIITNAPDGLLQTHNTKLGYLKNEFDITGRGLFIAPKFYMFEHGDGKTKFVHKGMRNIHLTFNDLLKIYKSGRFDLITSSHDTINKFRGSIKRVNVDSRLSPFLSSVTVKKKFKSVYDKRIILDDKINTVPRKGKIIKNMENGKLIIKNVLIEE